MSPQLILAAFVVAFFLWKLFAPGQKAKLSVASPGRPSATFRPIQDNYKTYDELHQALRRSGLESSNLIVGVDFTRSNEWTGKRTFGGLCLHALSPLHLNPYQSVIQIVGRTLEVFDDDKLIPAFGFGDKNTTDRTVFPFRREGPCQGFAEVLDRYTAIVPQISLLGPTSFAPLIREAIKIVKENKSYHILVIIADGQVTNEAETQQTIVEASNYPLSIILVGVGDGPWEMMKEFDDGIPERRFDNFQFVDFHQVMTRFDASELAFACAAMQEIPEQFQEIKRLKLFENCK
jgi:hypothetical protein